MNTFKVYVKDRSYTEWEFFETTHFQKVQLEIDVLHQKLFNNDVFVICENENDEHKEEMPKKIELLHSTIRSGTIIPGVLILEGNKTYGKSNNSKKNSKLLYKCIPDDMRLPSFCVPYEIKHIGFSKVFTNIYITFSFNEWKEKHPTGSICQVIGSVNDLHHFYEYQLYCKSLNASIQQFQRATKQAIEKSDHCKFIETICDKYPSIIDRKEWNIFTIDPQNSLDYDDAFSIIEKEDGTKQLSIYISNVTIWMETLQLWSSFSRRISTIYLPDKKRPMLPTILSDCLCSLQENVLRIAFVMDVHIQHGEIIDVQFHNCLIKVTKNYVYEEPSLLENTHYATLLKVTKELSKNLKYINNIRTSHDVVCYLMILMNYECAKKMVIQRCGIFRSTVVNKNCFVPDSVPDEVSKFIKIWNSSTGQYINGSSDILQHEWLNLDAYIHITSPIRRLVDLLNMIKFQQAYGMITLSNECDAFYNQWLGELEYINTTMRSIRKVQCECSLLDVCCNQSGVLEKEYEGFLFDKLERNDCLYQYICYLPQLKLSSRITLRDNVENFSTKKVKLHLFHDEEKLKRKIRLEIL
jgi:hypothetical protein